MPSPLWKEKETLLLRLMLDVRKSLLEHKKNTLAVATRLPS